MSRLTTEFIDSCAKELGSKRHRVELPWERSGLKEILNPSSFPELKIPAPTWVDVPALSSEAVIPVGPQSLISPVPFKHARAKLSEITWAGAEDKKLHFALQCWKIIVLDSAFHTKLGKILLAAIDQGKSEDDIFDIITDSFADKATSTLRSRSASLLAFGRWKKSIYGEVACGIFPITEDLAYQYLCDLRRNHAAASRRKRFLEAVGFSKGLIGADVDEVLNSSRVKGVAHGGIIAERKKKIPFTVCQVDALEKVAIFSNGQVSIFAGYVCFLIHCRLRWSDGQHCIQEPTLDVSNGRGFIEASLYHHKTAKKRRLKVLRLLPAAGVLPGLSGGDWASRWLENRITAGLSASLTCPTMPAPLRDGGWSRLPLTSSEAAVWLREILHPFVHGDIQDIATHSAKATVLSWLSKANVPLSIRRLAGYHSKPGDRSALEYSRDAAAPVLHQIEAVYIAVKAGRFHPDEPRSRRWVGCNSLQSAMEATASFGTLHEKVDANLAPANGLDETDLEVPESNADEAVQEVSRIFDRAFKRQRSDSVLAWDDNTTLRELIPSAFAQNDGVCQYPQSDVEELSSSSSSSFDTDSSSDGDERRAEFDGDANSRDLVAPSDLARLECYVHFKSRKLHFIGRSDGSNRFFKCGRILNSNYSKLDSTPAFAAHGCLTCFNFRDAPEQGSESE